MERLPRCLRSRSCYIGTCLSGCPPCFIISAADSLPACPLSKALHEGDEVGHQRVQHRRWLATVVDERRRWTWRGGQVQSGVVKLMTTYDSVHPNAKRFQPVSDEGSGEALLAVWEERHLYMYVTKSTKAMSSESWWSVLCLDHAPIAVTSSIGGDRLTRWWVAVISGQQGWASHNNKTHDPKYITATGRQCNRHATIRRRDTDQIALRDAAEQRDASGLQAGQCLQPHRRRMFIVTRLAMAWLNTSTQADFAMQTAQRRWCSATPSSMRLVLLRLVRHRRPLRLP